MIRIGTSGWRYPEWRDGFYRDVPQRRWLSHLAGHVSTIEINSSFYRLQPQSNYRKWVAETPPDFTFAVKGPKLITHVKRLRHIDEPVSYTHLGAGWPFWLGGITPYLDRSGISEKVTGKRFLAPGVASVPA